MSTESRMKDLFAAIDSMNTESFLSFLTEDSWFRFANWPAAEGKENVRAAVDGFFQTIKGLSHELDKIVVSGDHCVVPGTVTYTRLDDKRVSIPFCNFYTLSGDKIKGYDVYIDPTPLLAE